MAIAYKCKCCAANLDVEEGMRLVKCPACKTKQTLPSSRDENIQNLFNRATTLRLKCEFDKAEATYERIIQADEEQYEAYWGLILCKFGVEYVEDPKTETRIPTCHRTSFESISSDANYRLALKYALDEDQQALYREEAEEIDKIQKGILEVAQNEEPYDVFICYKETDENGRRTQDSVIANDIYHQLRQEGFKVFYAAITLEGKLGSAYEPIIFAALNSAKVMLAIGTKPEYFNAVWVRNEWSRFLKMNKDNRSKLLIPCYRGMDPYDLPEEFSHLQAQDMGKIGFINDLIRGIKKVIEKNEASTGGGQAGTRNLLKRAYMFLNDGDFENAKIYCEKVLDIDAESSMAYLYALLIKVGKTTKEALATCDKDFSGYSEYKRAYQYGNEEQRQFLDDCLNKVRAKISAREAAEREAARLRAEREAEEARLRAEQEAEAARLRAEIAAENARLNAEYRRKKTLEGEIEDKRKQLYDLQKKVTGLREEIVAKKKEVETISKKIFKGKIWAVIHLLAIILFVTAIVLVACFSEYEPGWVPAMAILLVSSFITLIVSFVFMLKFHPKNDYTAGQIGGYTFLLVFYDVPGIVFMAKILSMSKKKELKQLNDVINKNRAQIPYLESAITKVQDALDESRQKYKELYGKH